MACKGPRSPAVWGRFLRHHRYTVVPGRCDTQATRHCEVLGARAGVMLRALTLAPRRAECFREDRQYREAERPRGQATHSPLSGDLTPCPRRPLPCGSGSEAATEGHEDLDIGHKALSLCGVTGLVGVPAPVGVPRPGGLMWNSPTSVRQAAEIAGGATQPFLHLGGGF